MKATESAFHLSGFLVMQHRAEIVARYPGLRGNLHRRSKVVAARGTILGAMALAAWLSLFQVQAADEVRPPGARRSPGAAVEPANPPRRDQPGRDQPRLDQPRLDQPRLDQPRLDQLGEEHPLDRVIEFAQPGREAMQEVKDYVAVFTKTELVGNRMVQQTMNMKCRQRPFSVYFRFRNGPEEGREVIYVAGAYGNNLVVHETGIKAIAGTMSLRPNDPKVMEENRYPITQVGIGKMLETALAIWESEKSSPPANVDVQNYPNAKLGQTECHAVQITHHQPQRGLKFHLSRVYFDKKTKLPVHAERYGWPRRAGEKPPLVEKYSYSNIRMNVGLTDADFDPRNPEYGY